MLSNGVLSVFLWITDRTETKQYARIKFVYLKNNWKKKFCLIKDMQTFGQLMK